LPWLAKFFDAAGLEPRALPAVRGARSSQPGKFDMVPSFRLAYARSRWMELSRAICGLPVERTTPRILNQRRSASRAMSISLGSRRKRLLRTNRQRHCRSSSRATQEPATMSSPPTTVPFNPRSNSVFGAKRVGDGETMESQFGGLLVRAGVPAEGYTRARKSRAGPK